MKIKRKPITPKSILYMTPLIDVVFLLLIFFMLSSTFVMQPGIKINLPDSALSEAQKEEDFSLIIQKNGLIMLNDQIVKESELDKALQIFLKSNPNKVLIIKADKEAKHGQVVKSMGLAKKAGVRRFAIATKPGFDV